MSASSAVAQTVRVETVSVPPDAGGVGDGGMLPPPGSVVIYVGDTAAPAWQRLRAAALRRDWQGVRDTAGPDRPAEPLVAAARFFDVRYAGHTLVRDRVLPAGMPFGTQVLPYTGGPVEDEDFEIVEHADVEHTDGDGAPRVETSYLLLRRAPRLSRVERELLGNVSPDVRHIHMGRPQPCGSITTMDAVCEIVGRMAREAVAEKRARGGVAPEDDVVLSGAGTAEVTGREGELAASVDRLLAVRRRLLFG
ncbi:hypothetical protein [Streptomyces sp. XH2]|uniref:hypothetical protein n=1 Tax=Streptomyces sp. XH2 TaxID=3412483 RepID=UPI003C7BB413